MTLREVLRGVATGYSRETGGPGQAILEQAQETIEPAAVPAGWVVRHSRGIGEFTHTPWLGFFNPDETTDPKVGTYVCWILEPDLQHAVLTIQQGTESLTKLARTNASIPELLGKDARALRGALDPQLLNGLTEPISFGSGKRQRRYAAGSVAHRRFRIAALPTNEELLEVHRQFCELLEVITAARDATLRQTPGILHQSTPRASRLRCAQLEHFKPKSSDDYLVHLKAFSGHRSRRHEAMLNQYARWASDRGWTVASPHPVDLRLRRGPATSEGPEAWNNAILLEAKVVYRGNVTVAVREAIGQLSTYPYLAVPGTVRAFTKTAALFSEDIGDLWLDLLERELAIATLWWGGRDWVGGKLAKSLGLVA